MKRYTIEVRGWELTASAFSLNQEQIEKLKSLMESHQGYDLHEYYDEIEDELDIYFNEGNLFNLSKPFFNSDTWFIITDENDKVVDTFDIGGFSDIEDVLDTYEFEDEYVAIPDEDNKGILLTTEESKGGLYYFYVESENVPKPEDFAIMPNSIDTPIGDYDLIDSFYFKGEKVEIEEWLGGDGKSFSIDFFE